MGCERVRDQLCTRLGTTLGGSTADGRFTLLPIVCLGACDRAPVMLIDGDLHVDLDEHRIDQVLEKYT
jgi:NADH-quinone oxidoreductase subunit E